MNKRISTLIALSVPFLAYAIPKDVKGVQSMLCTIADWVFTFALTVGIICVIYAAFLYMTAGGSSEKVGTANKTMIYAVVGIAIALIAGGVPSLVASFLDTTASGCS